MRKILSLLILSFVFLASCEVNKQDYYICLRICENENIKLIQEPYSYHNYFASSIDAVFDGEYFLNPYSTKEIDVISITSTNEEVIEIKDIDLENKRFSAITKSKGNAKIRIKTASFFYSTSLPILVN